MEWLNTRRAYTETSNDIGESLDLWEGMLGQREVTFEFIYHRKYADTFLILEKCQHFS